MIKKKNIFIGVNTNEKTACVLSCPFDFREIEKAKDTLDSNDFDNLEAYVGWGGRSSIENVFSAIHKTEVIRKLKLVKPITFYGYDQDMGNKYDWAFRIDEIWSVK